jgi:hypothetical protein
MGDQRGHSVYCRHGVVSSSTSDSRPDTRAGRIPVARQQGFVTTRTHRNSGSTAGFPAWNRAWGVRVLLRSCLFSSELLNADSFQLDIDVNKISSFHACYLRSRSAPNYQDQFANQRVKGLSFDRVVIYPRLGRPSRSTLFGMEDIVSKWQVLSTPKV